MKLQISLDDELAKRVDDFADRNYMSRSGLISLSLVQFLNQAEAVQAVKDMAVTMQKIADNGGVDHETMEQLEDFERVCKYLTSPM